MSTEIPKQTPHLSTSLLATMRMAVGASALLLPMQSSKFYGVPMAPNNKVMARLFGVRDLVIGLLLWTSRDDPKALQRALWAGLITDAVDVCSCSIGVFEGTVGKRAVVMVGAGAASFFGLGLLGLRSG